jgi:hypothetical protein
MRNDDFSTPECKISGKFFSGGPKGKKEVQKSAFPVDKKGK